jgi:23S rRNA pseudouridine1911/1915/1917 synthase
MSVPPAGSTPLEIVARVRGEPMRLDQFLTQQCADVSRTLVRRAIDAGAVTVNGAPSKASYKVRTGDHILVTLPDSHLERPQPENIALDLIYEDEFLAVVNKPANMVVHPARGNWSGTLVNALEFHFDDLSRINGDYRPGIVHRLDRDTSGAILVAKEEQTHRALATMFEGRKVFKEYLAITAGVLDRDSDYIESKIGRHPSDRIKMIVADEEDEDAKDACTYYEVIERFRGFTYCRLQPRTGRTHQLRVHLTSIGCPVLADKTYSGRDRFMLSNLIPGLAPENDRPLLERQALHAARIRFRHPRKGEWIEIEAPLHADMQQTLAALREFNSPK